jgi:CheY-like chemotaxis protein
VRVLVIDDAPEIRRIAVFSLVRFGKMQALEAATGAEGIEVARRERPDAILLDLVLPDLEGTAVLAALKGDPATAAIPVVLLSATLPERERLRELGAQGALAKPFDPMGLPAALLAALSRA